MRCDGYNSEENRKRSMRMKQDYDIIFFVDFAERKWS